MNSRKRHTILGKQEIYGTSASSQESAQKAIKAMQTGKGPGIDWTFDDLNTWSLQAAVGELGYDSTLAQLKQVAARLEQEQAQRIAQEKQRQSAAAPSGRADLAKRGAAATAAGAHCHAVAATWQSAVAMMVMLLILTLIVGLAVSWWRRRSTLRSKTDLMPVDVPVGVGCSE